MAKTNNPQLLLTRIDHEVKVLNVMRTLLEDGQLTDVTLACEGQLIHAHKLILSSVSNYFQTIFQNPMLKSQSNPVILVKDMKMTDLKAIIDFVYSGEVRICGDQLESLVRSAATLDISGLNSLDPNPSNHVSSKTTSKNETNSPDENGPTITTNGSLPGKSNRRFSLQRNKANNSIEKPSLNKKDSSDSSNSTRGTRSSDRRSQLEPSEGNNKTPNGNLGKKTLENITETKNDNSTKLEDNSRSRELRYNFRAKLKEAEESSEKTKTKTKCCNEVSERKSLKSRRSSICEPVVNVENTKLKPNSEQLADENSGDCLKQLIVGQKLTNISNKTPEFKKPFEPSLRSGKLYNGASGSSNDVGEPPETDEAVGSYMRHLVYDKQNKMNLKRDDDVQSICSVTTRSRRSKLEGCEKDNPQTTSSNQNVATTRTKRTCVDAANKKPTNLNRAASRKSTVTSGVATRGVNRSIKVDSPGTLLLRARHAKLRAALASSRMNPRFRSANRVDWKGWFESQQKIAHSSLDRRRKEAKAKLFPNPSENNKSRSSDSQRSNLSRMSSSSLCLQNLRQEQIERSLTNQQSPQIQNHNQNGLNLQSASTNTIPDSDLDLGNNPKRKQIDSPQEDLNNKQDSGMNTSTRNLRPKRAKSLPDTPDNPSGSLTSNISSCSVASSSTSLSNPSSNCSLLPGDTTL